MEIEKDKREQVDIDFNFTRKVQKIVEKKDFLNEDMKKKLRFAAFIVLGGAAIGLGMGFAQTVTKGYLIEKQKNANIEEIQAKNEEVRKNKQFEIDSKRLAIQKEKEDKEAEKNSVVADKLALQQEKLNYNVWLKNRSDIIANYESQLGIYDVAYRDNVGAVKSGLISLDDLTEIRNLYQDYKKSIHEKIKFIENSTSSFDTYYHLDDNDKTSLNEDLVSYQSGSLNRNDDLEAALFQKVALENDDTDKIATIRKKTKDKIIDDLADIVKNDNVTTKVKKLKR